jgi:hypothetical protein
VLHVPRGAQHQAGDVADGLDRRAVAADERLLEGQLVQVERVGDGSHGRPVRLVQPQPDERAPVPVRLPGRLGVVHRPGPASPLPIDRAVHDRVRVAAPGLSDVAFGPGEVVDEPGQRAGDQLRELVPPPCRPSPPQPTEHVPTSLR